MAVFTDDTFPCVHCIDIQCVAKRPVSCCDLAHFTTRNGPKCSLKWAEMQKPLRTDVKPSLTDSICDIGKSCIDTGGYCLNAIVILS